MNRDQVSNGWLHTGTWSNESSLSSTPEPFEFGINHEASAVWERGDFAGLSTPPSFHFNVNQQYVTGMNVQQQPHVQPLSIPPHGGNPVVNIRPSVLYPSFSSAPISSSQKRHYSSFSAAPYRQDAAHISPQSIGFNISHGQPYLSQYDQHNTPLKKRRRDVQMPNSGVRLDVLSKKPRVINQTDQKGQTHGQIHVFGAHENVRRDLTASESARTNSTRKLTACGRCKALKQRCDRPTSGLMPCANCLRARNSATARPEHGLCIRVDINDLSLHRNGTTGTPFLKEWLSRKEVLARSSFPVSDSYHRTIQLSQGIDGIVLEVSVAQYITESEDKIWYVWKDSNQRKRTMTMPAYYICDMESTKDTLLQKLESDPAGEYLISLLRNENYIIREAFREAHRLKQRSALLSNALSIWCGTRFTELTWTICGDDRLGFAPPTETDNPWNGTVPVTPIMDTQLDEIAINSFLKPYDGHFLRELHRQMTNPDTTNWYEVLLALFIILHNFQCMFIDVMEYTTRHGMKKSKSQGGASLSERNVLACKSLLAYFHFVYRGSRRFFSVMKKGKEIESMPEEQQKFLNLLHRFMSKKDQLKDWQQRDVYTDRMFWIIQLLIPDWKGDFKLIGPIDDFTEEDLLTT